MGPSPNVLPFQNLKTWTQFSLKRIGNWHTPPVWRSCQEEAKQSTGLGQQKIIFCPPKKCQYQFRRTQYLEYFSLLYLTVRQPFSMGN